MDEKYRSPLVRERLSNYYTALATTILVFVAIAYFPLCNDYDTCTPK